MPLKTFKAFILFAVWCLPSIAQAQEKPENPAQLAEVYSDYFSLNREAIFLHLNKTAVAPSENVWFAAYSYSPQFFQPNLTTNLHVNLYTRDGVLMEAKVVEMANGFGEGYFLLDTEKYAPGEYLIRAGTRYMDNFTEDAFFTQSFLILGETDTQMVPREYDLQLLPEGGHFIAGVENTIGVKLIDNAGKGVNFKQGKILGAQQEVITTFQSNRFGLSKFRMTPLTGEGYMVHIELEDGEELTQALAEPEIKGIALTSTPVRDQILFTFKTNQETLAELESRNFLFAFHKDGAMKALNFTLSDDAQGTNVTLAKDALYKGMNTITVFNEKMEPVVERLIFNRDSIPRMQLTADYKEVEVDSLVIGLRSSDPLGLHSLSVSVLPAETLSYQPNNNIFSGFYIKPYIQGNLENGGYYFSEEIDQRRRDYDLDLLLLTQGWSKYSWNNIFANTPKENFEHEFGFTLTGTILNNNSKRHKQLFIGSTTDRLSVIADLAEDGSFKAENIFVRDSARITFSLINDRNSRMSEPKVVTGISPEKDTHIIEESRFLTLQEGHRKRSKEVEQLPRGFIMGAERLEAVYLEAEIKTEDEKLLELERKLGRGDMYGRFDLLSDEEVRSAPTVLSLLRSKGFEPRGDDMYSSRELMRKGAGAAQPAKIVIDGMESSLTDLFNLRSREIKSIYTNKTGKGSKAYFKGAEGGGLIEIVLRGPEYGDNDSTATTLLKNGFSEPKEFYVPKYSSYTSETFRNYGSIGWFPQVILDDGHQNLKIFNVMQPVKLFIEGLTEDGALIHEEILIKNPNNG